MKKKLQEIHAYSNGNNKEGGLFGANYWSTKKSTKAAGQRENETLLYSFSRETVKTFG